MSVELWRCRACGTLNDFDGAEVALNETELCDCGTTYRGCPKGHFALLSEHKCAGCDFAVTVPPMWFVVPTGEEPVYIEAGFARVVLEEVA